MIQAWTAFEPRFSRKDQGTWKGKQPTKKRPAPQVSPPESSFNEESWPTWQQLQEKCEAKIQVRKAPQPSKAQVHHSAREAKSHHRAKLRAIADDLMSRFAILETKQQVEGMSRWEADGATVTP